MNLKITSLASDKVELLLEFDDVATFKKNQIPKDNLPPKLVKQEINNAIKNGEMINLIYSGIKLVGYYWFTITERNLKITSIAVHPKYRRKGIGEYIIDNAIDLMKKYNLESITLSVDPFNSPALLLYFKKNFYITDYIPDYFLNEGKSIPRFLMTYNNKFIPSSDSGNKLVRVDNDKQLSKLINRGYIGIKMNKFNEINFRKCVISFRKLEKVHTFQ